MKLKAKGSARGVNSFVIMAEQDCPKGEKDAKGKPKQVKFMREVSDGLEFEVADKLGHKLMSIYPDNLEVVQYGEAPAQAPAADVPTAKAMEAAPQNKAIHTEKTK